MECGQSWKLSVDVIYSCGQHLNKVQPVIRLDFHSSSVEVCERNVLSGFRVHSSVTKSEVSALIDLTTRSAKKLMVGPSATVGLGLNSAASHDVSYDSLFTASETNALTPWLVGLANESGHTSPRFSRTWTDLRFTGETLVTSCGRRLTCESSLPRTRCQW